MSRVETNLGVSVAERSREFVKEHGNLSQLELNPDVVEFPLALMRAIPQETVRAITAFNTEFSTQLQRLFILSNLTGEAALEYLAAETNQHAFGEARHAITLPVAEQLNIFRLSAAATREKIAQAQVDTWRFIQGIIISYTLHLTQEIETTKAQLKMYEKTKDQLERVDEEGHSISGIRKRKGTSWLTQQEQTLTTRIARLTKEREDLERGVAGLAVLSVAFMGISQQSKGEIELDPTKALPQEPEYRDYRAAA